MHFNNQLTCNYFCFCFYLQFADDRKQTGQVCDKVQHQTLIYTSVGSDIDISHVDIRIYLFQ